MSLFKHYTNIILIALLLIISALSYHPIFVSLADENAGSRFSFYVVGLTIALFLLNIGGKWRYSKFLFYSSMLFLFAILIGLIIMGLYNSYYENELRNVAIALVITFIGYNSNLSLKNVLSISLIYYFFILIVTGAQVRTNIGGFIILDSYAAFAKNSLGVLASVATIGLYIIALSSKANIKKFLLLSLSVILFALILTIRARASSIAVFLICLLYTHRQYSFRSKKTLYVIFGIVVLLTILIISGRFHYIGNFIYDSLTQHYEADFSNERVGRGERALEMFAESPLWGILDVNPIPVGYTYVHNFALRILTYYGILGGFFLILIYLFQTIYIIRQCLRKESKNIEFIGFWIMLSLLFSSLVEPTFPYGPGTAVLGAYLSLGFSLRLTERVPYSQ